MSSSWATRLPTAVKLGVPLTAALLAAACASSSTSSTSSAGAGAASSSAAASGNRYGGGSASSAPASASPAAAATTTVIETRTGSDGTFLTNGSGRTVYMFAKDAMDQSACSGACAAAWPPVTVSGKLVASGSAKASDLGMITRSDGAKQATYDGHALYYFAGDSAAGQTNGQGLNGFGAKWWLVAPSGTIITAAANGSGSQPASSPTASKAGGSWS